MILKKAVNFLFYDELYKHLDRNIKQAKSFLEKRKILLKHDILKQGMIRNMGLLLKI